MPSTLPPGVFWAEDVEALEADPVARLAQARKYMPIPVAFREAATALRILILDQTKQRTDGSDLLSELYVTAAQANFLLATPFVPGAGSRYNVAATIPKHVWQRLPMPYPAIGYRRLRLLTPTDCDWLVVAWGEPEAHVSAQEYHRAVWDEYVAKCSRERRSADRPRRPARR
jgi:hypothetical protein